MLAAAIACTTDSLYKLLGMFARPSWSAVLDRAWPSGRKARDRALYSSRMFGGIAASTQFMREFSPHLEVLPAAQRKPLAELTAVRHEFVLYGGTALALHLGHRDSLDCNFFGDRPLDLSSLEAEMSFLAGARIVQRE